MKERRQGPDWLTRVLRVLVLLCWAALSCCSRSITMPAQEIAYGFLVYGGIQVRDYWDPALTPWLVHGLWGCCALTLAVLLLERKRSRRRDDALHVNLAILLLVLIAGLLFYYVG